MMERDKINRSLLGPTKKVKKRCCLTVKDRTEGKYTITCMHYPDTNSKESAVEAAVANEVNDDIHDDIRTRFSLKFVISISKWYTLLS